MNKGGKNKPVYLCLSKVEITKNIMYKFWYHYIKPKYEEKANLWYMNTDKFRVYIKTKDPYIDYLQKVLKQYLVLQITKLKDHYSEEKTKN